MAGPAATFVRAALTVEGRTYDPEAGRWVRRSDRVYYTEPDLSGSLARILGISDDGTTFFARGLRPRVERALRAAGFAVRLESGRSRVSPRLVNDLNAGRHPPPVVRAAVAAVRDGGPALFALPRGTRTTSLVRHVVAAFPKARVLVPAATRAEVRALVRGLDGTVGRRVCDSEGYVARGGFEPLVNVVTRSLFGRIPATDNFELVVIPDALPYLRSAGRIESVEVWGAPAVGFVRSGTRLDEFERLRAEALFQTPTPIEIPSGRSRRGGNVVSVFAIRDPGPRTGRDLRDRVWNHPTRARDVAAVARVYHTNDVERLSSLSLAVSDATDAPRVAVLVETAGHARRLAEHLPAWEALTGNDESRDALPAAAFVTDGWRMRYGVTAFDVLIDARAADPIVPSLAGKRGVVVVDVRDEWDAELSKRSDVRLAAYARVGFRTA